MKWLPLVLLLTGCAAPLTQQEQAALLIQKYGPPCGLRLSEVQKLSEAEAEKYASCIRLLAEADRLSSPQAGVLNNLGQGFRDAGYIMGGSAAPVRPRDFMCFSDCSRRYSAAYCESACSY